MSVRESSCDHFFLECCFVLWLCWVGLVVLGWALGEDVKASGLFFLQPGYPNKMTQKQPPVPTTHSAMCPGGGHFEGSRGGAKFSGIPHRSASSKFGVRSTRKPSARGNQHDQSPVFTRQPPARHADCEKILPITAAPLQTNLCLTAEKGLDKGDRFRAPTDTHTHTHTHTHRHKHARTYTQRQQLCTKCGERQLFFEALTYPSSLNSLTFRDMGPCLHGGTLGG